MIAMERSCFILSPQSECLIVLLSEDAPVVRGDKSSGKLSHVQKRGRKSLEPICAHIVFATVMVIMVVDGALKKAPRD